MRAPFRPIGFDAWCELQIKLGRPGEQVDCLDCDGTGELECHACSHESECESCDGQGVLVWDCLTDSQKKARITRTAYAEAVIDDAVAWAGWLGRDPVAELSAAGLRVWSSVTDRRLHVDLPSAGVAA